MRLLRWLNSRVAYWYGHEVCGACLAVAPLNWWDALERGWASCLIMVFCPKCIKLRVWESKGIPLTRYDLDRLERARQRINP